MSQSEDPEEDEFEGEDEEDQLEGGSQDEDQD